MWNIKTDEILFTLKQENAAISMSFCKSSLPLLATGDTKGIIIL